MADWDTFAEIDGKAVAKRVKELRTATSMTQVSLAKMAQVSQQSICAIERGDIKLPRALPQIAAVLGTTSRYLTTGVESDGAPIFDVTNTAALKEKVTEMQEVTLGAGYSYLEPTKKTEKAFAIKCLDDAMVPDISNGDLVVVDLQRTLKPGVLALIGVGNDIMIRKVKMQTQDKAEFVPANEFYPIITGPDEVFGVISEVRKLY